MKALIYLFLASLLFGQIGGISLAPGIVMYVHDVLLVILIIVSASRFFRGNNYLYNKLLLPIAFFIAAAVISLCANVFRFTLPELIVGSLYLVRWILYAALYFLVVQDRKSVGVWLHGLYAMGVVLGLIGLVQFFFYPDLRNLYYLGWDPHYYRLFSTLLDPNYMGIILVLTLLLGFGVITKKNHIWIIGGQIASCIALLLTYSRSSFLALGAAIIVWAVFKKEWKLIIVLIAFVGFIVLLPKTSGSTLNLFRSDSTRARVGNWQESLHLISKAPVFGYGFDMLRYVRPVSGEFISKSAAGLDSSILFILATTGVVGLSAYIYLLISMIRFGKKSIFYVVSFVGLLVHSLFVNSQFYPWVMIWIWIVTGAVICDT